MKEKLNIFYIDCLEFWVSIETTCDINTSFTELLRINYVELFSAHSKQAIPQSNEVLTIHMRDLQFLLQDLSESQSYLNIPPIILVQALFISWNCGTSFQRVSALNIPSVTNHLPLCCSSHLLKIQFNCITLLLETLCWHPWFSNKVYFSCCDHKTVHSLVPR